MKILNKIQRELKAPKNQTNNFGNYKYRSSEDILEAVKPMLGEAVLDLSDEIVHFQSSQELQVIELIDSRGKAYKEIIGGDRFYVKATATFTEGEKEKKVSAYAREPQNKKGMDSAQVTGATSSYARKYALNGLFLIDDTKDVDTTEVKTVSGRKVSIASIIKGMKKVDNIKELEDNRIKFAKSDKYTEPQKNVISRAIDEKITELQHNV